MIDVCRRQGVLLMYAEELALHAEVRQGQGNGRPRRVRQGLSGEAEREAFRAAQPVVLGRESLRRRRPHGHGLPRHRVLLLVLRPLPIKTVYLPHGHLTSTARRRAARTTASASSNSPTAAWAWSRTAGAKRGGMDDRIESLRRGRRHLRRICTWAMRCPLIARYGYGYAVEKAPSTKGWSYPVFDELWNYGFPHEMRHFARCVRGKEKPQSTGEDGRVVMEALYAAYASAGQGRKIEMPFRRRE